jgi:hypothetical protein
VGVSFSVFSYWVCKYNRETAASSVNSSSNGNFAELEVNDSPQGIIGHVELRFPNGVIIELEHISESSLVRLIGLK